MSIVFAVTATWATWGSVKSAVGAGVCACMDVAAMSASVTNINGPPLMNVLKGRACRAYPAASDIVQPDGVIILCQVLYVITGQTSVFGLSCGMSNSFARLLGETQVRLLALL